jgi:glycosyltransferase involved in cell wall biosynthesis
VPRPDLARVLDLARAGAAVVLQKPSLTFAELDALAGACAGRFVVDFDDAIWMGYGPGDPADGLESLHATLRRAGAVTTGSEHLAVWARSVTDAPVHVLPPAVDPARYEPRAHEDRGPPLLVWIGTSGNFADFAAAREPLAELLASGEVRLRVVADRPPDLAGVEWQPWSYETETQALACDVGIMPLVDGERTRGRCGYKAVQYAAAGLPVVASPVGAAPGLVEDGRTGFLAAGADDWRTALRRLADPELRARLGAAGRARVEERHTLAGNARRLAAILRQPPM